MGRKEREEKENLFDRRSAEFVSDSVDRQTGHGVNTDQPAVLVLVKCRSRDPRTEAVSDFNHDGGASFTDQAVRDRSINLSEKRIIGVISMPRRSFWIVTWYAVKLGCVLGQQRGDDVFYALGIPFDTCTSITVRNRCWFGKENGVAL